MGQASKMRLLNVRELTDNDLMLGTEAGWNVPQVLGPKG
jgi:hypothetical protein